MSTFELYAISTLIPNFASFISLLFAALIISAGIMLFTGIVGMADAYNDDDKKKATVWQKRGTKFAIMAGIAAFISIPIPDTKQMLIIYSGKLLTTTKGTKELPENVVAIMNKLATDFLEEDNKKDK